MRPRFSGAVFLCYLYGMLFNSVAFAVFLPLVFALYWAGGRRLLWQNAVLLIASYVFYGWWDWRFLGLIAFTSATSYVSGLLIERRCRPRLVSTLNIIVNLGILAYFKYCNFFISSLADALAFIGVPAHLHTLSVILPVGISFYTFQSLSYSIDIYRGRMPASHDPLRFFAFVSFFPQLVAGPIERASNLLPQFDTVRRFDYGEAVRGTWLILSGLFLKIVLADRLALFVDGAYGGIAGLSRGAGTVAAVFFAFQLYLDFFAYSEIARGTAKLFGMDIMVNFRRPYLSQSFREFWKRWHFSLSSWFMDYVYIPLGGNRRGEARRIGNLLTVFLLSGLWHGASWTFVAWGGLCGLFVVLLDRPLKVTARWRVVNPVVIFCLWTLSLVFFRAQTFGDALAMFSHLGFGGGWDGLLGYGLTAPTLRLSFVLIGLLVAWEVFMEHRGGRFLDRFFGLKPWVRCLLAVLLVLSILLLGQYGVDNDGTFIYFQF